ncbi:MULTISPECIES: flavin reductase family protein [Micromonospora]|uniref:flavin reductase family protein n=1 Tax=Micromonospora TaxID=1873 RepID=UPI001586AF58|nr:flavin reductase family protein [Micromonospora yangpuensis]
MAVPPADLRVVDPATDPAAAHRAAVRLIASGVAVLTLTVGGEMHGVTVSSLTAVSRDPLLVGICLNHRSAFLGLVKSRRLFAVSVLDATQADAARWFADPRRPRGRAQFDQIDWEGDRTSGAPLIGGAMAWMSCRLVTGVDAGDHELLLAEVLQGSAREGRPLLSFQGGLHRVLTTSPTPRGPAPAGRSAPPD